MADLKKDFEYYLSNKEDFLSKYKGKFVAIKNCAVLGVYGDRVDAIQKTSENHELGTFLVQEVTELNDEVRFHSRVAI